MLVSRRMLDSSFKLFMIHLILRIIGGQLVFWSLVLLIKAFVHGPLLQPLDYLVLALAMPLASIAEVLLRPNNRFTICYRRADICNLCQREVLFVLVSILGLIILSQTAWASRMFLSLFFFVFACWSLFMNYKGHRVLASIAR